MDRIVPRDFRQSIDEVRPLGRRLCSRLMDQEVAVDVDPAPLTFFLRKPC